MQMYQRTPNKPLFLRVIKNLLPSLFWEQSDTLVIGVEADNHLSSRDLLHHLRDFLLQTGLNQPIIGPLTGNKLFNNPSQCFGAELVGRDIHVTFLDGRQYPPPAWRRCHEYETNQNH
jgi:hypothetical protein